MSLRRSGGKGNTKKLYEIANKGRCFSGKMNTQSKGEIDSLCIQLALWAEVSIVKIQSRFGEPILMEA